MLAIVLEQTPDDVEVARLLDRLALVVSELASNALKYGGAPVTTRLYRVRHGWVIDVEDHRPHRTPVMYTPAGRAGGNGLLIVDTLSLDWGWHISGSGGGSVKHVWARIDAHDAARAPLTP